MTAQIDEKLIIDGEEYFICPFSIFIYIDGINIYDAKPVITELGTLESLTQTTMCWRGYIGTWEIKDHKLYLINLLGNYKMGQKSIFAEWFTGRLKIRSNQIPQSNKFKKERNSEGYFQIEIKSGFLCKLDPCLITQRK